MHRVRCRYFSVPMEIAKHVTRNTPVEHRDFAIRTMKLREKESTARLEKISVPFPAFSTKETNASRKNLLPMIDIISRALDMFGKIK